MLSKITIFTLLLVVSLSLRFSHKFALGQVQQAAYDADIDAYIRANIDGLQNAQLIDTRSQVTGGINYDYTYRSADSQWEIQVFDQPWLQSRQITELNKIDITRSGNQITKN